jgi:phage tail protein X
MAHKRRPPVAHIEPNLPTLHHRPVDATTLPGHSGFYLDPVVLRADTPKIEVIGRLTGKPSASMPQPRYEIVERPGRASAVRYAGHDPHTLDIPMALDKGGGAGVESLISDLERLAQRAGDTHEPPVISVSGAGIPHTELNWRLQPIEENPALTRYKNDGSRERFGCTLHLIEAVVDLVLAETIRGGQGLRGRRTVRARQGETLYDIARRVYGDPGRASDLQKANPWARFGQVFAAGTKIRVP